MLNFLDIDRLINEQANVRDTGPMSKKFVASLREIKRLQALVARHRTQKYGAVDPVVTETYDQDLYDMVFPNPELFLP